MTPDRARRIIDQWDRFTGGGVQPWAGMPGWDVKAMNLYIRARRVLDRARVLSVLRSGRIRPRLSGRDQFAASLVAWEQALSAGERRDLSLYLRGRRICARFDILSGAVQVAARTVEILGSKRGR